MIGAGNRARKYLEYILSTPERVRLAGVVDSNPLRRESIASRCPSLSEENIYSNVDDFFARGRIADAVIIATPDDCHYAHTMQAIRLGYHVLLEKPIAQTEAEAEDIARASRDAGVVVNVCYVLHFHPYFRTLRELARSGELGEIVAINHCSPVGIDRATHVYVRGGWGQKSTSGPLFTSKCCHDIDFLLWLTGSPCKRISSQGSLRWFTPDNAPIGASQRCVDCLAEAECPFSAVDLYRRRREWVKNFDVPAGHTLDDTIETELTGGRYGRCVYHCDNDVVDRQTVAIETDSGVLINISMDVFTTESHRKTHISLTKGEIRGDEHGITVTTFRPRENRYIDFSHTVGAPFHAGADLATVANFIDAVRGMADESATDIEAAVYSQHVCDAIEEARQKS
ncbi:MAG: Gfo/Idh/MocA family oxidoreductase [Muribaculaceae bacterium]|nr:Gfo/Idh/MocA family oxidoreductase [Muribaculaceae bacterium]